MGTQLIAAVFVVTELCLPTSSYFATITSPWQQMDLTDQELFVPFQLPPSSVLESIGCTEMKVIHHKALKPDRKVLNQP